LKVTHKFSQIPRVVRKPCFHCGSYAQGLVNPRIIAMHEMQGNAMSMVLDLF
jgi:hypothetical protein